MFDLRRCFQLLERALMRLHIEARGVLYLVNLVGRTRLYGELGNTARQCFSPHEALLEVPPVTRQGRALGGDRVSG